MTLLTGLLFVVYSGYGADPAGHLPDRRLRPGDLRPGGAQLRPVPGAGGAAQGHRLQHPGRSLPPDHRAGRAAVLDLELPRRAAGGADGADRGLGAGGLLLRAAPDGARRRAGGGRRLRPELGDPGDGGLRLPRGGLGRADPGGGHRRAGPPRRPDAADLGRPAAAGARGHGRGAGDDRPAAAGLAAAAHRLPADRRRPRRLPAGDLADHPGVRPDRAVRLLDVRRARAGPAARAADHRGPSGAHRPAAVHPVDQGRDAGLLLPSAGVAAAALALQPDRAAAAGRAVLQLPRPPVDDALPLQRAALAGAGAGHGGRRRPAGRLAPARG